MCTTCMPGAHQAQKIVLESWMWNYEWLCVTMRVWETESVAPLYLYSLPVYTAFPAPLPYLYSLPVYTVLGNCGPKIIFGIHPILHYLPAVPVQPRHSGDPFRSCVLPPNPILRQGFTT